MYKIIAVPAPYSTSNVFFNGTEYKFISEIPIKDIQNWKKVALYVVTDWFTSITSLIGYTVYDADGNPKVAIADTFSNDKPDIPQWLIMSWMAHPTLKFDVVIHNGVLHFESEVSPEPSQQERELQSFLDKIKVTKDDFEVIQLTKSNNFMLKHKKSQRVVLLEKKLHRGFFAGLDYQIQQEQWKFGENHEEILVLKPLTKIVIL